MKVILKDDVPNLGEAGQIVNVANGYGRNYLIPKGLAMSATPQNIKAMEQDKGLLRVKEEKRLAEANEMARRLSDAACTFPLKAGEGDKLFGSVTSADIAQKLEQQGIELDRKKIHLEHPIKSLGIFTVPVKLHPELTAELKVEVVKEEEQE
jgi:large subunit ribosomal protein L9